MGISCLQARQKTLPWAGSEGSSVPHAGQKFTSVSKAAKEGMLLSTASCTSSVASIYLPLPRFLVEALLLLPDGLLEALLEQRQLRDEISDGVHQRLLIGEG